MKKKKNWLFILPLLLCGILMIIYSSLFVWRDDTTAPVITIATEQIEVSVQADESELFAGVSALDDRDGDVTAAMVVEKISNITDDHTATITYAAFDKSGNVSKATRKVYYTDYTEPRFGLTRALVFQKGASPDVLSYVTVEDMVDGDLSDKVKGTLISDTSSLSYAGLHQIDFRVTNSMGDTVHLILPVDIYETGEYNATVNLTEYLIYIKKGEAFQASDYLDKLTVSTLNYSLKGDDPEIALYTNGQLIVAPGNPGSTENPGDAENPDDGSTGAIDYDDIIEIEVEIDDSVDTGVPGVYSVTYSVTMDRYKGFTRLNVVVEE